MKCINFLRTQVIIIAIVCLYGCSSEPVLETSDPSSMPNTITPVPSEISSSTADDVVLLYKISGHSKRVLDVVFSPEGDLLASSSQDLTIRLWDVQSGEEVHSIKMRSVDMADIDISIDNLLASGEAIWDLESMEEIHALERGSPFPASVAFSPDGSVLALGLFDQRITLWDAAGGEPVYVFEEQEDNQTIAMEFSPDGALLAVGVHDGTVRLLDIASGEIVSVLKYIGETDIHYLTFSPDGKYLATGGRLPAVVLWNVESGDVVRTFRLTDHAMSMDFSPDGKILATAGGSRYEVQLWDVESGTRLYSMTHDDQISSVAFSPDGKLLAVGCFDSNLYLWEVPTYP